MADAETNTLGCCSLCVYSALNSWCILHPFGADCCGGPRGCCGRCCDPFFNEDDFDERLKREQAKNGASIGPVTFHPEPSLPMSTTAGTPKPANDSQVD